LALALGACDQGQSAQSEAQIELVRGQATVESVEVVRNPSDPPAAQVVARGYLADGCTRIDRVEVHSGRGNILAGATITTVRPAGLACIQVIQPFQERFTVDLAALPDGSYVVSVNGVTQSFQRGSGNEQGTR
jgi:inhibitor of cysteine peptidase